MPAERFCVSCSRNVSPSMLGFFQTKRPAPSQRGREPVYLNNPGVRENTNYGESERCKVTHCIFDLDGLLLNTEEVNTIANQEVCGGFGKEYTWAIKSKMMGRPRLEGARITIEALDLPIDPEEYLNKRNQIVKRLTPTRTQTMPGVERLVRHLHRLGMPLGIATSSRRESFLLKTQKFPSLFNLFDVIVMGDDPAIRKGKPSPECYLEAVARLRRNGETEGDGGERQHRLAEQSTPSETGLDKEGVNESVLVFEDAPSGLEGALAAGMQVCFVPDQRLLDQGVQSFPVFEQIAKDERLRRRVRQLKSLENFEPEAFGIPPFNS